MPTSALYINQIDTDDDFFVWGSGQDIRRFNGSTWEYYNYQNSAVPKGSPYYLDTRCLSIDNEETLWCGVAQGVTAGYNEIAIFNISTNDPRIGASWRFSDLGTFSIPQEISLVYACHFGDDVLAFCSPLNGTGLTAAASTYSRIQGSTGGRLFYYLKETSQWKEKVDDYIWPHIYSMTIKGFDGKGYLYYVGTKEGLYVFPQGELSTATLNNGTKIVKEATVYNTHTSGIISDRVYALDFDEAGNLWLGTDQGLSYFDGDCFWNYGTTGPVTLVKARENGHVFYAMGDGELSQGTGLWHFNGSTHTQFTTSNSTLTSNDVLGIELVEHNIKQKQLDLKESSLWILGYNTLSSFDYDLPHIYATSKYVGATGWNFVYYSPTGGTSPAPIPKVDKYTWNYPEWQVYQSEYLADKHPGLDPRNLFLTTKLTDIADGRAGRQAYWNNYPIPTYDQTLLAEKISEPEWVDPLTVTKGVSGATLSNSNLIINSSTTLEVNGSTRLYVGGVLTTESSVVLGYYSDGTPAVLTNPNPSLGGASNYVGSASVGFVVSYEESGCVGSILPFRGYSTAVTNVCPSPSGNSIIVSGSYDWLIENGDFIFNSGGTGFIGEPDAPDEGHPVGLTNPFVSGLTGGSYSWIYDQSSATGGNYIFDDTGSLSYLTYTYSPGAGGGSGNSDFLNATGGTPNKFKDISKIIFSFDDFFANTVDGTLGAILSGYALTIGTSASPYLYGYYSVSYNRYNTSTEYPTYPASTVILDVVFQSGTGGDIATSTETGNNLVFSVFYYSNLSFPLYRRVNDLFGTVNGGYQSPGFFVAEVDKDLGSIFSFSGITGDYQENSRKSYKCLNFRQFPSFSVGSIGNFDLNSIVTVKSDSSNYLINSVIGCTGTYGGFSTLKNKWVWINDSYESPEILKDLNGNKFFSYLSLNESNFSLRSAASTTTSDSGFTLYDLNVSSLNSGSTSLITGSYIDSSDLGFQIGGITFNNPTPSYTSPFYLVIGSSGSNGITGGFFENVTPTNIQRSQIKASKTKSEYFVSTFYGGTGTYFGYQFIPGSTGHYALIAEITESATLRKVSPVFLDSYGTTGFYGFNFSQVTPKETILLSFSDSSLKNKVIKSDINGKILDKANFGTRIFNNPLVASISQKSDLYISAGLGTTGASGEGFIDPSKNKAFVLKSDQYVPELGINLGNIISRPGSGAWTWCDVHASSDNLEIPLMSTVVFNNYSSDIYGKKNNIWILSDSTTGEELLNVKSTPYFIYTFVKSGYYKIYNQVEDSFGNVYETSLPGFIKVTDHKNKRPDDDNPNFVDSTDYGYPEPYFVERNYGVRNLREDLIAQEKEILENNKIKFGAEVVIPDNPDATFNK
jgi:hypothetical protein